MPRVERFFAPKQFQDGDNNGGGFGGGRGGGGFGGGRGGGFNRGRIIRLCQFADCETVICAIHLHPQ